MGMDVDVTLIMSDLLTKYNYYHIIFS